MWMVRVHGGCKLASPASAQDQVRSQLHSFPTCPHRRSRPDLLPPAYLIEFEQLQVLGEVP